jgi:nucleotide-binding universal stress UspA family protein
VHVKNAILVPLDGTVQAEQAIPVAIAVARRTGAELHPVLVHLTDYTREIFARPPSIPQADRELELREGEYLTSVAERLSSSAVKVQDPVVLHGEVPEAIAEHVAGKRIGGVVMTTHAGSGLERVLIPSVTRGLRRLLTVPMIFVHEESDAHAPELDPARAARLDVVLTALDGSRDAEAALEQAIEIAGPAARYVLLRVVSLPPQLSSVYLPQATILSHRDEERLRGEAADYLARVEDGLRGRVPSVEKRLGVHSRPGHLVVRAAEEVHADLICVGSHGHGALRETLFGSVTNDVLRESRVPVLVTRPGH